MKLRRALTGAVVVALTATVCATAAPSAAVAQVKRVTASEIALALNSVRNLVAAPVAARSDRNSLAQNASVDIRRDGSLAFATPNAGSIIVTLPYTSGTRASLVRGGVTFVGQNSSGTFALPTAGGAQVLMVAANKSAPITYPFTVQNGTVATLPNGGLLLRDSTGKPNRLIPTPWARDADGKEVPTHYVVANGGTTFSQEVNHRQEGVAYPVVADPNYTYYLTGVVVTFTKWDTAVIGASSAFTAVWIAAASLTGQLGNKLYQSIWVIQAAAAWQAANNRCLWVWVPYRGNIETGGYRC